MFANPSPDQIRSLLQEVQTIAVVGLSPRTRLGFDAEEERQLAADRKHWTDRLKALASELSDEPDRIRRSYVVKANRVEPVGLVYLWPLSS